MIKLIHCKNGSNSMIYDGNEVDIDQAKSLFLEEFGQLASQINFACWDEIEPEKLIEWANES